MAFLLDVEFCRSASFSEGWWFLRAVMDLLEGKAGSGGTCLGTRGADRLTCLCWTGMSRDLNIFLREIWERSSQLIQLLERVKRRDGRKGTCMALLLPSFSGERRKKFCFQCKKKKAKVKIPQKRSLSSGWIQPQLALVNPRGQLTKINLLPLNLIKAKHLPDLPCWQLLVLGSTFSSSPSLC